MWPPEILLRQAASNLGGEAARMTDTHVHLTFPQYAADRPAVVARALASGVTRLINPGTDLKQSRAAVALAEAEARVWAAIGVHPQDLGGFSREDFTQLAQLARHPRVVAIGEVGLELSSRVVALPRQTEWLGRFCDLAREVGKPLIFHVRQAHAEFREFLAARRESTRGVVHCFSGTSADAADYLRRGLSLGVNGIATFPNARPLRAVLRGLPLGSLLLETDAPFLAPASHRGERNEPAYVGEIAAVLAELQGVTRAVVEEVTDDTADTLFFSSV